MKSWFVNDRIAVLQAIEQGTYSSRITRPEGQKNRRFLRNTLITTSQEIPTKSDNWKQRVGFHPHINEATIMLGPFSSCEIISKISTFPGSFPNQSGIQSPGLFLLPPNPISGNFILTQQMCHLFFGSKNFSEILISTFHSRVFERLLKNWLRGHVLSSLLPLLVFCWEGLKNMQPGAHHNSGPKKVINHHTQLGKEA